MERRAVRFEWVDAFRGIAALDVALFHGQVLLWTGATSIAAGKLADKLFAVLSLPAHFGYSGVMLFFLLSGYCIHHPNALRDRLDLRSFAIRRFFRIYPPYLAALLVAIVIAPFAVGHIREAIPVTPQAALASALMLQNYPHPGGPLADLAKVQVHSDFSLWSLPVEFELYLAYPLFLLAWRRWGSAPVFGAIAAITALAIAVDVLVAPPLHHGVNWASYMPTFLRFWLIWCAGAWLAEAAARDRVPQWRRAFTAAGLLLLAIGLLGRMPLRLPHAIEDVVWAGAFFSVMLWIVGKRGELGATWNRALRPLARLGEVSYSLYLVHVPIFTVLALVWLRYRPTLPQNYLVSVAGTAVAVAASFGFYAVVERPSIAAAKRLARRPAAAQSRREPAVPITTTST